MMPEVSAGSNQVGASVTCTAHVSWPSGPAARVEQGMPNARAVASARTWRRVERRLLKQGPCLLREDGEKGIGTGASCRELIMLSLRSWANEEHLLTNCSFDSAPCAKDRFRLSQRGKCPRPCPQDGQDLPRLNCCCTDLEFVHARQT